MISKLTTAIRLRREKKQVTKSYKMPVTCLSYSLSEQAELIKAGAIDTQTDIKDGR